ncbi:MAG TPA: heme-binding protein [Xanthobacteraceae bacterium]|nr:heme-binding protein [Xanthobacteraceae bacterium]
MHRSIRLALAVAALTLPIVVDGQVIGGIGASFDTSERDVQIAQAGLAALSR